MAYKSILLRWQGECVALVVFLRGVNVGGYRTFRPSILVQQLKHYDAVNIGAAGTFVIRKPVNQAEIRAELHRRLPFETEVTICAGQDLIKMASEDVFGNEPIQSDVVRFISVLSKRPHVFCPYGRHRSRLPPVRRYRRRPVQLQHSSQPLRGPKLGHSQSVWH
jgi:hypothetical protein